MSSVTKRPEIPQRVHRFSRTTLDALTSLILLQGLTRPDVVRSTPTSGESAANLGDQPLDELVASDAALAECLSNRQPNEGLVPFLLENPNWRDPQCEASERLWQSLSMAARLQTLEENFDRELTTCKQEAIYHFAYGLSHELNNPLANIATRAGVLLHSEATKDRQQLLETIIDNAMRGSEMLGDLMLIARPPKLNIELVQLAPWLAEFVQQATTWATRREIEFISTCQCQLDRFSFDPIAIREALWCLVRNAIEATTAGGMVELITTESDGLLILCVRDTGAGLSAEALRHCFDPYYSGREAGRGLGLGLSKARMISDLHRSQLHVVNRIPTGCEATLTLTPHPNFGTD